MQLEFRKFLRELQRKPAKEEGTKERKLWMLWHIAVIGNLQQAKLLEFIYLTLTWRS